MKIFAGKALFTVENRKTGNRFTFKVCVCDRDENLYFVSVLNGPDNYYNYTYLGIVRNKVDFTLTKKSRYTENCQSYKVFKWLLANLNNLPEFIEINHEGKCLRCGRRLTVPESIKSGFGPECINKV